MRCRFFPSSRREASSRAFLTRPPPCSASLTLFFRLLNDPFSAYKARGLSQAELHSEAHNLQPTNGALRCRDPVQYGLSTPFFACLNLMFFIDSDENEVLFCRTMHGVMSPSAGSRFPDLGY
jgi:hypothetical protein